MSRQIVERDRIDERQAQWAVESPDIDTLGMGILGRMRWITLDVRPEIEAVFARHGLDSGEFDVLATLLRSGYPYRLRPTELYRSLMISSGGLTDRLARLVKSGHVNRISEPNDGRSLLVELTKKGRRVAEAAFREDMAIELKLLSGLSSSDRATLTALLRKLLKAVETREPRLSKVSR